MNDDFSLRDYIEVVKKRWITVLVVALIITTFVFISTIRKPKVYEAKTTILIKSGGGSSSQLAGLAGLAGINLSSGSGDKENLAVLLQSKVVAIKVLNDLKLRERIKGWDNSDVPDYKLASSVRGMLKKSNDEGNLVTLRVEYTDPVIAAEVADGYADALAFYWNKMNYSAAQKKKEYIESQLPRVKNELTAIEKKIKSFTLLGRRQPTIELRRLEREFEIQNSVYTMLRKEYESVKLEESKKIMPFTIIDKAEVPGSPFKPRVKFNTQVGFFLGLFSGIFLAFFQEYWSKSVSSK